MPYSYKPQKNIPAPDSCKPQKNVQAQSSYEPQQNVQAQGSQIAEMPNYTARQVPAEKPQQLNFFEEKLLEPQAKAEHKIIGQVFDTYWLVEFHDNLYIIDQHAAHERVLYEQTLKGMKTREFTSQLISPPIVLNLSMQEAELLRLYMDQFTRIGFEIEEFGQDSYAVRAVPDNLFSIAKKELLMEMIDSLSDEINRNAPSNLIDEKIASMSCKAAVKGNMRLSAAESRHIDHGTSVTGQSLSLSTWETHHYRHVKARTGKEIQTYCLISNMKNVRDDISCKNNL